MHDDHYQEHRRRPRVKLNDRVLCFQLTDYMGAMKFEDLPLIISIKDISFGGIGAVSDTKLEFGDQVTIFLATKYEKCEFKLTVQWCHYNMVYYEMGFSYNSLTKDQLFFLDRYIKSLKKSQRK